MKKIPFTQYILPHGKKTEILLSCYSDATYRRARRILDAGFTFECEILSTKEVSLTITDREAEVDLAIEISINRNKNLDQAIRKLVGDFNHARLRGETA